MRLLAGGVLGLAAQDYHNDQAPRDGYSGVETLEIGTLEMNQRYKEGRIDLPDGAEGLPVNTGVILTAEASGSALGTVSDVGTFTVLRQDLSAFGMRPCSVEQRLAMAHLLNSDIGIVSLGGRAGTGKSSLALAAGLEMVPERLEQKKVVVFRPLYAVGGQDLRYLPGTEEEKMSPWTAAVHDALESFCSKEVLDEVASRGFVEIFPLAHIRGRTLTDTFVIVDEAQSLERMVLLSILSRLGHGSRVVLCHDLAQRDNLRVGGTTGSPPRTRCSPSWGMTGRSLPAVRTLMQDTGSAIKARQPDFFIRRGRGVRGQRHLRLLRQTPPRLRPDDRRRHRRVAGRGSRLQP